MGLVNIWEKLAIADLGLLFRRKDGQRRFNGVIKAITNENRLNTIKNQHKNDQIVQTNRGDYS